MNAILYEILFFIVLGGIGMAIANRKVGVTLNRQRWIKYFTYLVVTGLVLVAIYCNYFYPLAFVIIGLSLIELLRVNFLNTGAKSALSILSVIVFAIITGEFIFFAYSFKSIFILFIYFQILVFDGFCQIIGQLFGKHPLAPTISPSKTVEGLAGGWIFCTIAALFAANWLDPALMPCRPILFGLITGIVTGLSSFCGDMLASFYKRKSHVKDFSNWLPGQGGFLDRFDSLLMTGAFYYLLYSVIFKTELVGFINIAAQ